MAAQIRVGVDWDNDRFICYGASIGDALNIVPSALSLYTLDLSLMGSAVSITRKSVFTDYGISAWETVCTAAVNDGAMFGRLGTTINEIPVSASTTYTVVAWVRGITNYTAVPVVIDVYKNGNTQIGTSGDFTLTSSWQRITYTFNSGVGTTAVGLGFRKDNNASVTTFQVTGLMLVAGSTAPSGYNTGDPTNLYDVVTSDLLSAQWQLGMKKDTTEFADEGSATLELDNTTRRYSPEYTSGPLFGYMKENRRVTIDVYHPVNLSYTRMWSGWTRSFNPDPGIGSGTKSATVSCEQGIFRLADIPARTGVLVSETFDGLIKTVLSQGWVSTATPYYTEIGNSRIGIDTYISDLSGLTNLDVGVNTYEYLGDDWKNGETPAWQILTDLMDVEQGWMWLDRTGKLVFRNRDYYLLNNTPNLTIDVGANAADAQYSYGQGIINNVTVTYYPKQTVTGTLYTSAKARRLGAKKSVNTRLKATLPEGGKLTALSVNQTDATSNPTTFTAVGEHGGDLSKYIKMELSVDNDHIRAHVTNSSSQDAFISVIVRGTYIISYGGEAVEVSDETSITAHGLKAMKRGLQSRAIAEEDDATNLASFYVEKYKNTKGVIDVVKLTSRDNTWLARMIDYGIGSLLRLSESQLGITSLDEIIIEESFSFTPGVLDVTWTLDIPNTPVSGWILGTSALGTDTYLRY